MKTKGNHLRQIRSAFILVCLMMIHLGVAALMVYPGTKEHLPPDTWLNQVSLEGMTVDEAVDHVKEFIPPSWSIVFLDEQGQVVEDTNLSPQQLEAGYPYEAIREDLEKLVSSDWKENWLNALRGHRPGTILTYPLDYRKELLEDWVLTKKTRLHKDPQNATIDVEQGRVVAKAEVMGRTLETNTFVREIQVRLEEGSWEPFHFSLAMTAPEVTMDILGDYSQELVTYSSNLQNVPNRTTNIRLAGEKVNGQRIMPGERLSFNHVVGETLEEDGYLSAPVIANGRVVMGIGGGVCQVSSTLYQAALRAGFTILERWHHTVPVGYLPLGMDAAVSYGTRDLVIENPYDHPVLVGGWVEEEIFYISLFGDGEIQVPGISVEVRNQREISPTTKVMEDDLLDEGVEVVVQEGKKGHRLQVYRIFEKEDGQVTEELVSLDYYPPANRIIRRGTGVKGDDKK